jgi:hypothetical protein
MIKRLLAAALLAFSFAGVSGCPTPTGWKCEVERYGNKTTVTQCHRVGY